MKSYCKKIFWINIDIYIKFLYKNKSIIYLENMGSINKRYRTEIEKKDETPYFELVCVPPYYQIIYCSTFICGCFESSVPCQIKFVTVMLLFISSV